jgi:hypothetical protein
MADDADWDIEAEYHARAGGVADGDLQKARTFVMLRWMYFSDFRPFLAWCGDLDPGTVIGMFIHLAQEGRLKVTQSGRRHRHKDPTAWARSIKAALQYERTNGGTSDERFAKVAAELGMSPEYIRRAVTDWRKRQKASKRQQVINSSLI